MVEGSEETEFHQELMEIVAGVKQQLFHTLLKSCKCKQVEAVVPTTYVCTDMAKKIAMQTPAPPA